MAHIKKTEKGERMFDYSLYVIVSPFDSKKIYISKACTNRLYKAYSEHVNYRNKKTKILFEEARKQNLLPSIYLLEAVRTTSKDAYKRCVAWLKYFMDHGYEQVTKDSMTAYASEIKSDVKDYYAALNDFVLDDIFQPTGGLFPNYSMQTEEKTLSNNNVISIYVEAEEYEQIKNSAEEINLSMAAYCKTLALNGAITTVDLSFLDEQIKAYQECKDLLRQTLFSFFTSGRYYPEDIQAIQEYVEKITSIQEKHLEKISELIHNLR